MKGTDNGVSRSFAEYLCDICGTDVRSAGDEQFATLEACWRNESNVATRYRVNLCESCFGGVMANIRREHMVLHMFDDKYAPSCYHTLGLVQSDAGSDPDQ